MNTVTMYTGPFCPYCTMAKRLLAEVGVENVEEIRVDEDPSLFAEMQQRSGRRSVPQIFVGDTHIGGFTDLHALHQQGGLMPLLETD